MTLATLKKTVNQVMNFYRRPLPSFCISFASNEGKILFKQAMNDGQMENYFRLASQLRTQDEPAFCGLATLVMVLNALEVDPGRIWKGPWRWYHEQMLDCCIPLDTVKSKGITLDQFICISRCNGLTTDVKRMASNPEFEDFKNLLLRITTNDNEILVVSYSRKALGQTGSGHFASVGGFHPAKQMVLLFDTARFKYPPHWVPVNTLWEAMKAIDNETGQPRGYVVLTKDLDSSCLLMLATGVEFNKYMMMKESDSFALLIKSWNQWRNRTVEIDKEEFSIVKEATSFILNSHLLAIKSGEKAAFPLTCHSNFSFEMSNELETAMSAIIKDIVESSIGIEIGKVLSSLDANDLKLLSDNVFIIPKLHGCSLLILQDDLMKLTFLLSSWLMVNSPAKNSLPDLPVNSSRSQLLQKLSSQVIFSELSLQSQMELVQLSNKIEKMYKCFDRESCCNDLVCGTRCY